MELYYLSKRNTNCLKGLLAVLVMIHHFAQKADIRPLVLANVLECSGILAVAAFFFLSGFGLMSSYENKGDAYIRSFPRTRILPYYVIIVLMVLLSILNCLVTGSEPVTIRLIVKSLTFGSDTIVSKGWYLQVSLLSYIGFYLVYRVIPWEKGRTLIAVTTVGLFCVICHSLGFPQYYYQTVPVILLGVFWYRHRYDLDKFLNKKWLVLVIVMLFLCIMILVTVVGKCGYVYSLVASFLFIPFLLVVIKYIKIDNMITRYLGRISFEIYILHGMFMILFRSRLFFISPDYLYFAVVAVATVFFSSIAVWAVEAIYAHFRKKV
jgi:peptidoglycan/LPS O-acetylase OafA/YrhL